jgi:VanZ family protein
MNHPLVSWSAWSLVTVGWTAALILPINGPEFGDTEEMRTLTRLILTKSAHVSVYMVWTIFTGWLRPPLKLRFFLLMFLMAHAVGTEWCQLYFEDLFGRKGLLRDAALDHLGIFLGVVLSLRWWTAEVHS